MGERADRGVALFMQGYNCSQSVFAAFADVYGMDEATALKVSAAFGSGFGRMREVCGTVSGMALVCGMESGATVGSDRMQKAANYAQMRELAEEFRQANGSIICRELLGLSVKMEESCIPDERTKEYYKKRPCPELVRMACQILERRYFSEDDKASDSQTQT